MVRKPIYVHGRMGIPHMKRPLLPELDKEFLTCPQDVKKLRPKVLGPAQECVTKTEPKVVDLSAGRQKTPTHGFRTSTRVRHENRTHRSFLKASDTYLINSLNINTYKYIYESIYNECR